MYQNILRNSYQPPIIRVADIFERGKMTELENIRLKIKDLYNAAERIHVDFTSAYQKPPLKNVPAELIGVYPHIFCIVEKSAGCARRHTLQYTDVVTKQIIIKELNM